MSRLWCRDDVFFHLCAAVRLTLVFLILLTSVLLHNFFIVPIPVIYLVFFVLFLSSLVFLYLGFYLDF